MEEEITPIVIDCGSQTTKAGVSGEDAPRVKLPTIIGRIRQQIVMQGMGQKDMYVGDEILNLQGNLKLSHPIQRGIVNNWEEVEKLYYHVFYNEMRIVPEEQPLLLTEATRNPRNNSEKLIEMMLETFHIPQIQLLNPGVLVLYGAGKLSGMIVESGDGVTQIIPIHEGLLTKNAVQRYQFGGCDLTERMVELATEKGEYFSTTYDYETARDIKEKICYVSENVENEKKKKNEDIGMKYTLPDGREIEFGNERWRVTEALFDPSLIGSEIPGLHEMINLSNIKCDTSLKKLFWKNIVLSGGNTMFNGIEKRLENELKQIVKKNIDIEVSAVPERTNLAWIGGSVLASLSTFKDQWITKDEFEEFGVDIKMKKCFF